MTSAVRDLRLWQETVALCGDAVRLAVAASRRERKAVTDAVVRASAALALAVADGCARYEPGEQRRSFAHARRALVGLETVLAVGRRAGVLPEARCAELVARHAALSKLLAGVTAYVERQVELADAERRRTAGVGGRGSGIGEE
jgi:four helix bundle protein